MDWHDSCTEDFCLNPLHKGPCKGSGKGGRGGGGGKKKAAKKAVKKAPDTRATPGGARAATDAKSAQAAADIAGLADGIDGARFGAALREQLNKAATPDARNAAITEASLQLGRVLANQSAGRATPENRRRLAQMLAIKANDAIRSGNSAPLKELMGKLGRDATDDYVKALVTGTGGSRATAAAETFAEKKKRGTWKGMLAPINKPTGDGRMFAPEALTNRDLPLPLRFQRTDSGGHGGAVVVGRILTIEYHDDHAYGSGDWLDPDITPEVREAQEWSRQGIIGPSVDLDDAVMELVPAGDSYAKPDPDDCGCDDVEELAEKSDPGDGAMIKLVTRGRISGATLVQIPAFAECHALELSDSADDDAALTAALLAALVAGDAVTVDNEDDDATVAFFVHYSGDDDEWATVVLETGDVTEVHASRLGVPDQAMAQVWEDALLAGGTPAETLIAAAVTGPPAAWFDNPGLTAPTPLTVTADGRIFGHLAKWGVCHVGLPGCVTAPRSHTSYAFFHTGEVISGEGRALEVGKITLGTGHADAAAGFRAATDHYDHTGACVAVVRAGEDEHGIWVAGATTPECDDTKLAQLRRSPLSGDWRRIGSGLELVAALAVNVPGFPVPRSRVASGRPMSLVASGVVNAPGDEGPVDLEAAVNRVLQRRDDFAALDTVFAGAEKDRAKARMQTAAALLAVLE